MRLVIALHKSVGASQNLLDGRICLQTLVSIPDGSNSPLVFKATFLTNSTLID